MTAAHIRSFGHRQELEETDLTECEVAYEQHFVAHHPVYVCWCKASLKEQKPYVPGRFALVSRIAPCFLQFMNALHVVKTIGSKRQASHMCVMYFKCDAQCRACLCRACAGHDDGPPYRRGLSYLCETRIRTVMATNRRVPLQHPTTTTTARCRRLNHD